MRPKLSAAGSLLLRCNYISADVEPERQIHRSVWIAGITPDPAVDAYMKASALSGDKHSVTAEVGRDHVRMSVKLSQVYEDPSARDAAALHFCWVAIA